MNRNSEDRARQAEEFILNTEQNLMFEELQKEMNILEAEINTVRYEDENNTLNLTGGKLPTFDVIDTIIAGNKDPVITPTFDVIDTIISGSKGDPVNIIMNNCY
jgi:hypothetical protein